MQLLPGVRNAHACPMPFFTKVADVDRKCTRMISKSCCALLKRRFNWAQPLSGFPKRIGQRNTNATVYPKMNYHVQTCGFFIRF